MPDLSRPDAGADAAGRLTLRLLGELSVLGADGQPVPLPHSKRTRALLGYLVATGVPHLRGVLCDLLWDGPDDPRAALRWSLTKLRAVVDGPGRPRLQADRERVGFEARSAVIDVVDIGAALSGGVGHAALSTLEAVAAPLQGEFLDGLDMPACYRFHHWCMAERERWGGRRRAVLGELVRRLADEPERALPYARAMVAADPLAEAAHATLVRLLAAAGRYPDAEQHHGHARELLRREVSLPPGGALDDALREARLRLARPASGARPASAAAVSVAASVFGVGTDATASVPPQETPSGEGLGSRRPASPPSASTPPLPPPHPDARPVLVGRQADCDWLDAALQRLGHDARRLHLLTGEPGLGKSCLLERLAGRAAAAGLRILSARCFEAEMARPYGLWLDALRGAPDDTSAELPARIEGPVPEATPDRREQLFAATAVRLRTLASARPVVVLLDDLQWIDEGSAALLHFVARSLDDAPVLLAAAARVGELDDNPWAKRLLQSLGREGRLAERALAPLGLADVECLLARLESPLAPDEALNQTGGNPIYLVEMAGAARGGRAPAASLDALIGERLRTLPAEAAELLGWAAAMGRATEPGRLAEAAGWPLGDVLAGLERLQRRGLLRTPPDGPPDFAHDLVRQAVYRGLSPARRRSMHARIGRALAMAGEQDPGLHGERARHAALAGDDAGAAQACAAAAEHCLRVYANREAAGIAEQGLAHVDRLVPGTQPLHLRVELLKLRAMAGGGGPALAAAVEKAVERAQALHLLDEAASALHILSWLRQQGNDIEGTRAATLAAERMTRRADAATRCRQLANSGRCLLEVEAEPAQARRLLHEAQALAGELALGVVELDWGLALAARHDGDLPRAQALMARAQALARLRDDHWREYECGLWSALLAYEQRDAAGLAQWADAAVTLATRLGEHRAPFTQALRALAGQAAGPAEAGLEAALDELRRIDDKAHLAYALNERAALALANGQALQAVEPAREAFIAAQALRRVTEIGVAAAALLRARAAGAPLPADLLAAAEAALEATRGAAVSSSARVRRALAEVDGPGGLAGHEGHAGVHGRDVPGATDTAAPRGVPTLPSTPPT